MKARAVALIPFVPAGRDYSASLAFFKAMGFEKLWQSEGLTGLRMGQASFTLQAIEVPEWQSNQMITLEVDDLEAFWSELESRNLPDRFEGVKQRPPTDFPWGREVHIVDPAGVCWHVRQVDDDA